MDICWSRGETCRCDRRCCLTWSMSVVRYWIVAGAWAPGFSSYDTALGALLWAFWVGFRCKSSVGVKLSGKGPISLCSKEPELCVESAGLSTLSCPVCSCCCSCHWASVPSNSKMAPSICLRMTSTESSLLEVAVLPAVNSGTGCVGDVKLGLLLLVSVKPSNESGS